MRTSLQFMILALAFNAILFARFLNLGWRLIALLISMIFAVLAVVWGLKSAAKNKWSCIEVAIGLVVILFSIYVLSFVPRVHFTSPPLYCEDLENEGYEYMCIDAHDGVSCEGIRINSEDKYGRNYHRVCKDKGTDGRPKHCCIKLYNY